MYHVLKFSSALVMLFIMAVFTLLFGFWGFIGSAILALIMSKMYSRHEKEKIEKIRHEELLKAMQEKS